MAVNSSIWPQKDGSHVWYFDIVGVYEPSEASPSLNDLFFINFDYFDQARAWAAGSIHLIIARVTDQSRSGAVATAIDDMTKNSPFQTRTLQKTPMRPCTGVKSMIFVWS